MWARRSTSLGERVHQQSSENKTNSPAWEARARCFRKTLPWQQMAALGTPLLDQRFANFLLRTSFHPNNWFKLRNLLTCQSYSSSSLQFHGSHTVRQHPSQGHFFLWGLQNLVPMYVTWRCLQDFENFASSSLMLWLLFRTGIAGFFLFRQILIFQQAR